MANLFNELIFSKSLSFNGKKKMQIGLQMRNLVATTTQNSAAIFGPLEVV